MAAIDVTEKKDGGVMKETLQEGTSNNLPQKGDSVYVHYVGTLEDGSKFDSSRDRNEQFNFTLGTGSVIKAWDLGVATMKKGEKCRLVCKAEYAYGEAGSPPKIPPNSTLIFEVELFHWEGEDISPDRDKTITRSSIVAGTDWETPNDDALVDAHITGRHDGKVFFDNDCKLHVGECTEQDFPEGLDKTLKRMKKGEHSIITMKPRWAYGSTGCKKFNIPPNATIELEIKLNDFEKAKESWSMNSEEKLEAAEVAKKRGTDFFQQGKVQLATAKYKRICDLLEHFAGDKKATDDSSDEEDAGDVEKEDAPQPDVEEHLKRRNPLLIAGRLNLAMCYLKEGNLDDCIEQCDKVLVMDAANVKALYRAATALQQRKDYGDALTRYDAILRVEPNNKAAALQATQCRDAIKLQKEREKKTFANMFDKFAAQDYKKELKNKKEAKQGKGDDAMKENGNVQNGNEKMETSDEEIPVVDAAAEKAA